MWYALHMHIGLAGQSRLEAASLACIFVRRWMSELSSLEKDAQSPAFFHFSFSALFSLNCLLPKGRCFIGTPETLLYILSVTNENEDVRERGRGHSPSIEYARSLILCDCHRRLARGGFDARARV